jgi:hypothetical protein
MATQVEAQSAVMQTAHESWDQKRILSSQTHEAIEGFLDNVYTEYSTFRLCGREAAYKEACDQLDAMVERAKQDARVTLQLRINEQGGFRP